MSSPRWKLLGVLVLAAPVVLFLILLANTLRRLEHLPEADAKAKGVKFGRKPKLTPHQRREAIKRLAINYYGRSLLYELGAVDGLKTPRGFEIIPVAQAYWTLAGITAGCLVVAFLFFEWKEYRDVS